MSGYLPGTSPRAAGGATITEHVAGHPDALATKTRLLAGERLDGLLDDPDQPAQMLLDALA